MTPSTGKLIQAARLGLREAGHRTIEGGRRALASPRERRVLDWVRAGHDATLRQEYPLGEDSIVLDLGGWQGQWTSDIFARYCCTVHVFEPVRAFADAIERRFAMNPRVHVHAFGLAGSAREERLLVKGQGSSTFSDTSSALESTAKGAVIRLESAADFFEDKQLDRVDLIKINIEGGEYELLEHLLERGLVARITDLQIQFHDFVPDAERRAAAIQSRLAETHDLTFQSSFVWENWTRRAGRAVQRT
jgi:FkbM family methyltransferase